MAFKMLLCVLCVVILGHVYAGPVIKGKYCNDCVPFPYCKNAINLVAMDKSDSTINLIRTSFCGFYNLTMVKICCSDFDDAVPNVNIIPRFQEEHPNMYLLPDTCGKINLNRILGGNLAGLYEFPWMALIAYGENAIFGCSGTLINSRYVLTAAHCVVNKEIIGVRIGDYNLNSTLDCEGLVCENFTQDRKVVSEIIHNDYNWDTYTNDIALLRLAAPVKMPLKNADVICLPIQEEAITNKQATVAGWGLTETGRASDILRKVMIPVRPTTVCQDFYSHIPDKDPSQFCAGVPKKDSCKGDSGGPLMIETDIDGKTRFVQYGIVSNGPAKCGTSLPGIYTDVRKYVNWILDNIEP